MSSTLYRWTALDRRVAASPGGRALRTRLQSYRTSPFALLFLRDCPPTLRTTLEGMLDEWQTLEQEADHDRAQASASLNPPTSSHRPI